MLNNKFRKFLDILVPSATVFISSFCVMALELVAGRLIAKHLGSSLYTWTSVIGVILSGITVGYYVGGRLADKYEPRKTLSLLFAISSAACVLTIILNNVAGDWLWLMYLSWPVRTFFHVSIVFLLPGIVLGAISPVVVKMALDRGLPAGRTIGDIYAWGAAGSIAGTFATGFYLIAAMGTIAIIWSIGACLILMALLYRIGFWPYRLGVVAFAVLAIFGLSSAQPCRTAAAAMFLRPAPDSQVIYEDESQYCYIAVRQINSAPDRRVFMQDKLTHSEIIMGDIDNLFYFYTVVFAAVTHNQIPENNPISVLHIGGGGYVFPRYIEKHWPGSRNDVAEIDPGVTKAAVEAFGLEPDTKINTIQMDARNYVDLLIQTKKRGGDTPVYDFIYEDAFSDYSVPYQLVTKEFNDKLYEIMADDGVYIINLIDIYDDGLFAGPFINTLKKTFPFVDVLVSEGPKFSRSLFVIIASKKPVDAAAAMNKYKPDKKFMNLSVPETQALCDRENGIVLTDDFVPVENLLTPVVRRGGIDFLVARLIKDVDKLREQNKWELVIEKCRDILKIDSSKSIYAYNEIALCMARQGKMAEAAEEFRNALKYNDTAGVSTDMADIHLIRLSLGSSLKRTGKDNEAAQELQKAGAGFREQLSKNEKSPLLWRLLGESLALMGDFNQANDCFARAIALDPDPILYMKMAQIFESQGRFDEAIDVMNKAIDAASKKQDQYSLDKFKEYRNLLVSRNGAP